MTDQDLAKLAAKARTQLLKRLRSDHEDTVAATQELLRAYKAIHRDICQLIREKSKTVPEIAEALEMPAHEVLWHLTALRKYDVVAEDGMCGEYVLYKRVEA